MKCVLTLMSTDKTALDEAIEWMDYNGNLVDDAKSLSVVLPPKRRKLHARSTIDVNDDEATKQRQNDNT